MLRTGPATPSHDASIQQQTESHNQAPTVDSGPSAEGDAHALSSLVDLQRSRSRSPEHHDAPGRAGKRNWSQSDASTVPGSAHHDDDAHDQPFKKTRLEADAPALSSASLNDHPVVQKPAVQGPRLWTHTPPLPGASSVAAVSQGEGAGKGGFGGKVIDVPNLPMLSHVPNGEETAAIGAHINQALQGKHGDVRMFGYHVTPEEYVDSIRNEGFSAEKNEGKSGGIANANIHGKGLYTSRKPCNDYVMPDKTYVMFAVVVPKKLEFKQTQRPAGKAWGSENHTGSAPSGDYVESTSSEDKIHPDAIAKVGLVPIARIEPSMSPELLAMRPTAATSGQPPRNVTPELHNWVSEKVGNDPSFKALGALDDDARLDKLKSVSDQLMTLPDKHPDATSRLLMMDLKKRF